MLIRVLKLPAEFAEQVDASVGPLFTDIWKRTQRLPQQDAEH